MVVGAPTLRWPDSNQLCAHRNILRKCSVSRNGILPGLRKELIDTGGGPPPGAGDLFGLIYVPDWGIYFVDDGSNTLNLLH